MCAVNFFIDDLIYCIGKVFVIALEIEFEVKAETPRIPVS